MVKLNITLIVLLTLVCVLCTIFGRSGYASLTGANSVDGSAVYWNASTDGTTPDMTCSCSQMKPTMAPTMAQTMPPSMMMSDDDGEE